MQIAINISEESYKNIKEQVDKRDYPDMQIGRAIADGVLISQEPILNKIRAEILQLKTKTSFTFVNIDDVLRLIDKHMESKENENIN